MRKNEYKKLEEFTSQYVGVWDPSNQHWLGLEFTYHGKEYRFHTGLMYKENRYLSDGRKVLFGLYLRLGNTDDFILLKQFATMEEVLESKVIENTPFREVIMADETLLTGQD